MTNEFLEELARESETTVDVGMDRHVLLLPNTTTVLPMSQVSTYRQERKHLLDWKEMIMTMQILMMLKHAFLGSMEMRLHKPQDHVQFLKTVSEMLSQMLIS